LATIHEILVGGTEEAWSIAYPHDAALTDDNLNVATSGAIEILLRDNAAHAVDPSTKGSKKSKFRKAALGRLTFKGMRDEILARYQALADKIQNNENA